jgi:radical SAM-linked protein
MMKYWVRYAKGGSLRFVGHLDMLHAWERVLRRSRLPLAFSQGFSPRPLLSLAAPLPVGQYSRAEYLELELREELPAATVAAAIRARQLPETEVLGIARVPEGTGALMGLIRYADYLVSELTTKQQAQLEAALPRFLAESQVVVEMQRKRGLRQVDIRPLVRQAQLDDGQLQLTLAIGSQGNLRPELLLEHLGVKAAAGAAPHITRQELYLLSEDANLISPLEFCR